MRIRLKRFRMRSNGFSPISAMVTLKNILCRTSSFHIYYNLVFWKLYSPFLPKS
jgi:hypothetical protein